MICTNIKTLNFRNSLEADVNFTDGVNVLVGNNAQGKTNLLEAFFYASVGKSFRAANTSEIIKFGENMAEIELLWRDIGMKSDQSMLFRIFKDRRRIVEKNHVRVDRLSDIVGSFRAVLFCPEHLSLIKDGPSERRAYMDIAISRLYPMYIHALQNYNHSLKQRNALIKNAMDDRKSFDDTVELWSMQMADAAAVISDMRAKYAKRAAEHVCTCFAEMTGERERPELIYCGSAGLSAEEYSDRNRVRDRYIDLLMSNHQREIYAGSTLWGIHKDDLDIRINGKSARIYASQGQQRSLALALKLAEGEICREEFGDYPVFLFDDVLSELDGTRRDYLINKMSEKQVILTSCEVDFLSRITDSDVKKISVKDGVYQYQ